MMAESEARVATRKLISGHIEECDPKRIHFEKLLDDRGEASQSEVH